MISLKTKIIKVIKVMNIKIFPIKDKAIPAILISKLEMNLKRYDKFNY